MSQEIIDNIPNARRAQVYAKFDGYCAYCGRKIAFSELDIDHVLPKSKGGTNDLSNLFPSCRTCNRIKASRSIEEFRTEIVRQLASIQDHITVAYGLAKTFPNRKVQFLFEKRDQEYNN